MNIGKQGLNEALYKSSLEELERVRKQFEKNATSPAAMPLTSPGLSTGSRPPSPKSERVMPAAPKAPIHSVTASATDNGIATALRQAQGLAMTTQKNAPRNDGPRFSVNEELINAGHMTQQNVDSGVRTAVAPVQPPKPEPERTDKNIDDKLHKLEERIE